MSTPFIVSWAKKKPPKMKLLYNRFLILFNDFLPSCAVNDHLGGGGVVCQ